MATVMALNSPTNHPNSSRSDNTASERGIPTEIVRRDAMRLAVQGAPDTELLDLDDEHDDEHSDPEETAIAGGGSDLAEAKHVPILSSMPHQKMDPLAVKHNAGEEVTLQDLDAKQLRAALGRLALTRAAWSCFSPGETSRLLRPLQIRPELTGTSVLSPEATAEIVYKFPMADGRVGHMTGLVSIEDFRADRLGQIFDRLQIHKIRDVFTQTVVEQMIDPLRPLLARPTDDELWQETLIFSPKDVLDEDFLLRGLKAEAIPRRFHPHLQSIYARIMEVSPLLPNLAFQVCLRAYLEYNDLPNQELLARLLSRYFYTLYRLGELPQVGSAPSYIASFSAVDRRRRRRALASLLTVDADSDITLADAGLVQDVIEVETEGEIELVNPGDFKKLRQDVESAQRIIDLYQEENKQELIKRLRDQDKFLMFSTHQFFEGIFDCLPDGVRTGYGATWVPRSSLIDENFRDHYVAHLHHILSEDYLSSISAPEVTIINYWRNLAGSFYDQTILNQYQKLRGYGIKLEEEGIPILSRERFIEEIQLRFAARHEFIVKCNREKIMAIAVDRLGKRVAINTANQSFQAMRARLANVLEMEISRQDMAEIRQLINHFSELFLGKHEHQVSPYPVGTILAAYHKLQSREQDGTSRLGVDIITQLYQEYMRSELA